ncbi:hypothetical protein HELRODRAFT_192983 [Helobdella robusta]|uniref:Uncharacterized protein n=1 Tax=Helobdella robusta TaxID=6412 RepID=T1FUH5_HELRO|nr:hypothetical protein HELRODRAFT_192983 [Helobdella robusta]ESN98557.1 hypothetical protein HELRODRAFT_192983 [Helobdella robusta]
MSNNQEIDNNEARQREGGVLVEPPRVHNGEPEHHSGEKIFQLSILSEDQTSYYSLPSGYYFGYVDQPTYNYQEIYLKLTPEDFIPTPFDSSADDSYISASEDVFISTAAEVTSMASTAEDSLATSNAENSLIASAAVQDNVENVTATAAITPSDKTESADGRDGNDLKNDVATKLEATTAEEAAVEAAAMNEKQEITTTPGLLIEKKNVEMTKNIRKKYEELCNQLDLKADDFVICLTMSCDYHWYHRFSSIYCSHKSRNEEVEQKISMIFAKYRHDDENLENVFKEIKSLEKIYDICVDKLTIEVIEATKVLKSMEPAKHSCSMCKRSTVMRASVLKEVKPTSTLAPVTSATLETSITREMTSSTTAEAIFTSSSAVNCTLDEVWDEAANNGGAADEVAADDGSSADDAAADAADNIYNGGADDRATSATIDTRDYTKNENNLADFDVYNSNNIARCEDDECPVKDNDTTSMTLWRQSRDDYGIDGDDDKTNEDEKDKKEDKKDDEEEEDKKDDDEEEEDKKDDEEEEDKKDDEEEEEDKKDDDEEEEDKKDDEEEEDKKDDEEEEEKENEEEYVVVETDDCSAEDDDVLSITPSSRSDSDCSQCLVM